MAIDGGTGWMADFVNGEFRADKRDQLKGKGLQVVSPSECVAPGWCDHGSTFKYSPDRDAWVEHDSSKGG